jgi:hypothetical protein
MFKKIKNKNKKRGVTFKKVTSKLGSRLQLNYYQL